METFLCFFGSLQSTGRRKSRVNPRVFAGLSTAKTTILQFGLDDCPVRVGWFCSSGWTADSRHWLLSISDASSYLHRLLWAQKKHETIHSIKATYPQNVVFFLALTTPLSVKILIIYIYIHTWVGSKIVVLSCFIIIYCGTSLDNRLENITFTVNGSY